MINELQKAQDLMNDGQYMPAVTILQNINRLSPKAENR